MSRLAPAVRPAAALVASLALAGVAFASCTDERSGAPVTPPENVVAAHEAVATPCTKDLQGLGAIGGGWFGVRTDGTLWLPDTIHNPIGAASERVLAMGTDNVALADMDGEALHNCVLKQNGDIWCWGMNPHGQLGNGVPSPQEDAPVKVVGLPMAAKQVAVGIDNSCALLIDGTVWCWGSNEYGQLGNGQASSTDVLAPVQVTGLGNNVDVISIGYWHGCALKAGNVYCWGDNLYGEVGNGSFGGSNCNGAPNCVLTPTLVQSNVQKVSAGGFYTCSILNNASLTCWGDNFWGQLGLGDTSGRNAPTPLASLGNTLIDVETAVHATCAIVTGGVVRCWGSQDSGRLGNGVSDSSFCNMGGCVLSPAPVSGPLGTSGGAKSIREAEGAACVVKNDGHVFCWGGGGFLDGQPATTTPVEVDFCGLPSLTSLTPDFGLYTGGTVVTLNGDELHAGATVTFGNAAGTNVQVQSPSSIQATTPNYGFTDTVDVVVTNPDGHKARLLQAYSFTAAPSVSQVLPGSGPTTGGQMVTISGSSFLPTTTIDFGGVAPTNVTFVDVNTITATTPPHAAGNIDVTVTNPGNLQGTLAMAYQYIAPITIASLMPTTGSTDGSTSVTLKGDGFDFATTVKFDGVDSPSIVTQDTQTLIATAPAHAAGVVDVVATRGDGTSFTLPASFTYVEGAGGAGAGSGGAGSGTGGAGTGGSGSAAQQGPGNGCYCALGAPADDADLGGIALVCALSFGGALARRRRSS